MFGPQQDRPVPQRPPLNDAHDSPRNCELPAERPIRKQMTRGIVWMTAARFSVQGLGMLRILVLARLLTPADFGVVALATSDAALLSRCTHSGSKCPSSTSATPPATTSTECGP